MQQSSGSECCSKCKTFGITSKRTFNVAAAAATALAAVATCLPELPPRIRHAHKASPSHSHSYSHSECNVVIAFNWFSINFALDCGLVSVWIKQGVRVCVWHSIWPAFWPARLCQLWHTYIAAHTYCKLFAAFVAATKQPNQLTETAAATETELNWQQNAIAIEIAQSRWK